MLPTPASLSPRSRLLSFQECSATGNRNFFKLAFSVGINLRRFTQTVVSDPFISSAERVQGVAVPRSILHPLEASPMAHVQVSV